MDGFISNPAAGFASLTGWFGLESHGVVAAAGLSDVSEPSGAAGFTVGSSSILRRLEGEANWSGVVCSEPLLVV